MAGPKVRDAFARPLRDLRISVMDRCSFRCPYCMPEADYPEGFRFLSRDERLNFDEIVHVAQTAVRLGVRKLRLTGGEPLLRPDLPELVARLAALDGVDDIALTTNGLLLPRQANALREAGLHRVTVSLDALDPVIFKQMSGGRGAVEQVLEGIEAAREAGFPKAIKLNTVVQRGVNESEIRPLAAYCRHRGIIARFIEYMDVGTRNGWQSADVVRADEIRHILEEDGPLTPLAPHYHGEVARRYRYQQGGGEVGLIASVTAPFCGGCSRARLSSDGQLHTCLFSSEGHDLRAVLRPSGEDITESPSLEEVMRALWQGRHDRYSEERAEGQSTGVRRPRVEMNYIGG